MPIIVYVVQPGDTVYNIARRYGVTPQSIITQNKLTNPDLIFPGQKLLINVKETGPSPVPPGRKTYIVQPGDTLYAIARRYQTTVEAILKVNPGIDPYNLQVGQQILVPVVIPATAIFQGNVNKSLIAFTFDATYGDNQTTELLNILSQYGIKATWFISGIWAQNYPDLLKAINAAGHEIGNHGQTHAHMTELSAEQMRQQLTEAEQNIKRVIGRSTNLFRPPFGEYNQTLLNIAAGLGYYTIMWTVDSLDWQNPGPEAITRRVLDNLKNGAIILMHNAAPDTPPALPGLIDEIIRRGYRFGTVSEVLDP